MTERLPRQLIGYDSKYSLQRSERAKQKSEPADLIALMALENSGEPVQRYVPGPGEIDRGTFRQRFLTLLKRYHKSRPIDPYEEEGWY